MIASLLGGLLLGLGSSVHCLAMCGPLALWAANRCVPGAGRPLTARASWWYQAGRVTAYAVIGTVAGTMGRAIASTGLRQGVSLGAGAALLVGVLWSFLRQRPASTSSVHGLAARALAAVWHHLPAHPATRAVLLGACNALLPCGMLYGAIVAAAGLGSAGAGALFAAGFGLGSVPAFQALVFWGRAFARRMPRLGRFAPAAATALVGLLLIARGLGGFDGVTTPSHLHQHAAVEEPVR